jgi:thiosulfate/3-mercaptopyruvate sulfurtransferase
VASLRTAQDLRYLVSTVSSFKKRRFQRCPAINVLDWICAVNYILNKGGENPLNLKRIIILLAAAFFLEPASVRSGDMTPIVTTQWLAQNLSNADVRVLDIRTAAQYTKGHIPGSLNTPFNLWATNIDGLTMEVPSDEKLRDLLGKSGVDPTSLVVVVNRTETDFSRADATRVAWTCLLAGIKDVAVLDGGYNKWVNEKRVVSTDTLYPEPRKYSGTINRSLIAPKGYVLKQIGKSILVDTRLPQDYFGISSIPGHIRNAVDLPAPWVFVGSGTYVPEKDLQAMAAGVIGTDRSKEVIVYCDVGGYASTWCFLLARVLGYRNVKLYDGSMEEWTKDPLAPVESYAWH